LNAADERSHVTCEVGARDVQQQPTSTAAEAAAAVSGLLLGA